MQDSGVETNIDKDTGNEYSYVTVKGEGASVINPYATLTEDGKVRKSCYEFECKFRTI